MTGKVVDYNKGNMGAPVGWWWSVGGKGGTLVPVTKSIKQDGAWLQQLKKPHATSCPIRHGRPGT